jgi:hypothetical protein
MRREDARAPEERRREDGRNEPGGGSRRGRDGGQRAASLGPTFRRADRRPRPRGRRKLSERPASEAQPARPSAVLAPSRVQRRGVEARRVVAPCVGRRGSKRHDNVTNGNVGGPLAGGTSRAARQRRDGVGVLPAFELGLALHRCCACRINLVVGHPPRATRTCRAVRALLMLMKPADQAVGVADVKATCGAAL